ncbi:peptidoglycan-binding protein [Actinomadura flavalba]|uniref:peptidoglycan-binding protein n=1 Tax=Actinomadura flavalba TaxID=1120938 RepID=UPI000368D200|nr:peptidoglycan-binding protein [Actinomadura flavalba]
MILGAAGAAAVVAGGAAFAAGGDAPPAGAAPAPGATAPVTRGDLVDTETVDGTLGHAGARQVWTGASGTVTWAPAEGRTIRRGGTLLRVQGEPVTLFYGGTPMYRTLAPGVPNGRDVRDLERNLRALGYGSGMTVDTAFTAATAAAVRAWQDDRGLPETGSVDAAQIVFLSGAVRVTGVKAAEGARTAPGQPALTVASTRRSVHVDLDAAKQDLAREGAPVTVELPDGRTVKGRIASVDRVATKKQDATTIGVDVELDAKAETGRFDEAPVTVELAGERRENVLSVPVEALLALREGGFGVEVGDRVVAVTTGAFGGGRVEISGAGITEGVRVGVAAS